ncbi:helicase HerA-like domain-containing protein [Geoalkalibacter sp.]|uniref:helicase HerA-like domain-containing protein n=1 Tax=Geoalkalibacter sp. TaxID=3041440 RepID=UPI00272ED642|nr:helicase HerA-like domain-containing protein [Geoalkalibacter sp.]
MMASNDIWWLGRGEEEISLLPVMANRHGLVAGATGTGKTVTLRALAESFSDGGVPVFLADAKGDLTGLALPGGDHPKVRERVQGMELGDFAFRGYPVAFWDLYGSAGHPVRATVSEMGPQLLGRILGLNDTQSGVLNLIFRVADDQGLLLLDLKDLQAMAAFVGENAAQFRTRYGNVSTASIGAIQRALLALGDQGGAGFFGEPALDLDDLLKTSADGRGIINILAAERLMRSPQLYATFLLWLLAELFERLPEVGDPPKPKLIFVFDEAHLLFNDTPPALVSQIEQVVRLIRSKGVGVYFVTQNPTDLPDSVLGQLGLRIQHALRAFTPRDQKAVRVAAQTFRPNPALNVEQAITELGVGEALVSLLDARGTPTPVQRTLIRPPRSRMQPLSPTEQIAVIAASPFAGRYEKAIDRESAHEVLLARASQQPVLEKAAPRAAAPRARQGDDVVSALAKSAARSIGSNIGRQVVRGVLGALFGGKR